MRDQQSELGRGSALGGSERLRNGFGTVSERFRNGFGTVSGRFRTVRNGSERFETVLDGSERFATVRNGERNTPGRFGNGSGPFGTASSKLTAEAQPPGMLKTGFASHIRFSIHPFGVSGGANLQKVRLSIPRASEHMCMLYKAFARYTLFRLYRGLTEAEHQFSLDDTHALIVSCTGAGKLQALNAYWCSQVNKPQVKASVEYSRNLQ